MQINLRCFLKPTRLGTKKAISFNIYRKECLDDEFVEQVYQLIKDPGFARVLIQKAKNFFTLFGVNPSSS